MRGKHWYANGENRTITEWAKFRGIQRRTLHERIQKAREAGELRKGDYNIEPYLYSKRVNFWYANGEKKTLPEWAKFCGVTWRTLYSRIQKARRAGEILHGDRNIEPFLHPKRVRYLTYRGETKPLTEWAKDEICLCSYQVLLRRYIAGEPPGQCLKAARRGSERGKQRQYSFEGEMLCLTEIAKRVGISPSLLYRRVRSEKRSLEEAISEESIDRGHWGKGFDVGRLPELPPILKEYLSTPRTLNAIKTRFPFYPGAQWEEWIDQCLIVSDSADNGLALWRVGSPDEIIDALSLCRDGWEATG